MKRYGGHILLVEDNAADALLISDALSNSGSGTKVTVAKDGMDAMKYLPSPEKSSSVTKPDLIILDLNMPRKDGRTLLSEIKGNPHLKCIPVVVLTSSESVEDVHASYCSYANSYFSKPPKLDDFYSILEKIKSYWLGGAKLPVPCDCGAHITH